MSKQQHSDKPTLHLLHPDELTFENLMKLFRDLTGRDPTPKELEEARAEWDREESAER